MFQCTQIQDVTYRNTHIYFVVFIFVNIFLWKQFLVVGIIMPLFQRLNCPHLLREKESFRFFFESECRIKNEYRAKIEKTKFFSFENFFENDFNW